MRRIGAGHDEARRGDANGASSAAVLKRNVRRSSAVAREVRVRFRLRVRAPRLPPPRSAARVARVPLDRGPAACTAGDGRKGPRAVHVEVAKTANRRRGGQELSEICFPARGLVLASGIGLDEGPGRRWNCDAAGDDGGRGGGACGVQPYQPMRSSR